MIAGRFSQVTGADGKARPRKRIALIDLDLCRADKNWIISGIDARVTELAVHEDRLFIGGDFETIDGRIIEHIAEASLETGEVDPTFSLEFEGEVSNPIVALGVSPDGTRLLVGHRTAWISGAALRGTAVIDISDPLAGPSVRPIASKRRRSRPRSTG